MNYLNMKCPNCNKKIKLDKKYINNKLNCIYCGKEIILKEIKEITTETYLDEVIRVDKAVILNIYNKNCDNCKKLEETLKEVNNEYKDLKIVKLNAKENMKLVSGFMIRAVPTMILFLNGVQVDMRIGAIDKNALQRWLSMYNLLPSNY
ncbi:thioredoxin [Hypnocyclicus thermotrophus]|uniref:Thioredoxin n=1 Tax=Hypnocyclicus thermotrophus TaxID=1627895 RepID=A0AA46I6S9_9FUSO|nr:thioredoxin [Hypnocyclicus thermotrophus]